MRIPRNSHCRSGPRPTAKVARWRVVVALLFVALAALFATPAHAQNPTVTLVSNFGSVGTDGLVVGDTNASTALIQAQKFTTGAFKNGYTLQSLKFKVRYRTGQNITPRVSIYTEGSDGKPGSSLYRLTGHINSTAGRSLFGAPAGAALRPNTAYFVVFEDTDSSAPNHYYGVHTASGTVLDTGSQSGWTMGRGQQKQNAESWTFVDRLAIELKGTEASERELLSTTMTAGRIRDWVSDSYVGYSSYRDYGSLGEDTFTFGNPPVTYTILALRGTNANLTGNDAFGISITPDPGWDHTLLDPSENEFGALTLEFAGETLPFSAIQNTYSWYIGGNDWRHLSWNDIWLTENAPSLSLANFLTTLPRGGQFNVRLTGKEAPTLVTASVNGSSLVLAYDENLDANSVPAASAYSVMVGSPPAAEPSTVAISGKTVTLTLATAAVAGDAVTLNYTVPPTNPVQDAEGNSSGALSNQDVTNITGDNTAPTLVTASVIRNSLVLTYDENLDTVSVPAANAYSVMVGSAPAAEPSTVAISGKTVTLTLATAAVYGDTATLNYTVPLTNPVQDIAGVAAGGLLNQDVTNVTYSDDSTLSDLVLEDASDDSQIMLAPEFFAYTTFYNTNVGNYVDEITAIPTVNEGNATYVLIGADGAELTDADTLQDNFQVSLSEGANTFDPSAAAWLALSENKELTITAGDSTSTGMVTITALNGDDFDDYQVLTVEGTARNRVGANGPDPVRLTIMTKDAGVIGYAENGTDPVVTFTSTDPENSQPGEGIDWDLTGVDADDFLIDTRGMLTFRRPPDHEGPTDRERAAVDLNGDGDTDDAGEVEIIGNDNLYQITVRATEQMTDGPDHRALSAESQVTVMVIDVNEPGELTINRVQPEVGTPITAILSDPDRGTDTDGTVGSGDDEVTLGWQWYVSKVEDPLATVESHWVVASGAGNATTTYTPAGDRVTDTTSTAVDEGRYLRAVVRYLDMGVQDTDDNATVGRVRKLIAVTANAVRAEVSSDLDEVQNPANGSPGFSPADSYTRTIPENSPVGTPIGDPVVAVDPNDDTLTYELDDDRDDDPVDTSGDVGHFSIDMATGHITVERTLDHDNNPDGYEFYVRAIDPSGETAEVMVTVIAADTNDAPVIMGSIAKSAAGTPPDAPSELHVYELDDDDEDAFSGGPDMLVLGRPGSGLGAKYIFTAMDEDARGQISWEIEGEDVDSFVLTSTGLSGPDEPIALMFRDPPDHEAPTDGNRDNVYKVTLVATDSHGAVDSRPLTVFVDNVEELGKATLSEEQPLIGAPITATVEDVDGSVGIVTWQWMRATTTDSTFNIIPGATTPTYTPVEADGGYYLRAYATYIDSTSNEDDPLTSDADERTQKVDGGATVPREATMLDGSEAGSDRLYRVMVPSDYAVRVDSETSQKIAPPEFSVENFERMVVENAEVGTIVGEPVRVRVQSGVTFKYDLDATVTGDDRYFTIDADSGQIRVGEVDFPNPLPAEVRSVPAGATAPDTDDPVLDYESANTFTLVVTATDIADSSRQTMTTVDVILENLNERPYFDRASREASASPKMYGEQRSNPIVQMAGVEPDGHDLRWEVTGDDASYFTIVDAEDIDDGKDRVQLVFRSQPDYENGKGSATTTVVGDTYSVTVRATEMTAVGGGPARAAELPVTVQVTNANEPGTVDFNLLQPEVGTPLTATVSDLDNVDTSETRTWTWYRAKVSSPNSIPSTETDMLASEWVLIDGASAATYEPRGDKASTADVEDSVDEGRYLLARVEYTDGAGTSTAVGMTAHPVRADVSDTDNNSPDFNTSMTVREVSEDTAVGMSVGEPVDVSSIEDGDVLAYSLDDDEDADNGVNMDTDVRFFSIDRATGQIMVSMPLSAEQTDGRNYTGAGASIPGEYVIFVRATDSSGEQGGESSDEIEVAITATDVNEAPRVSGMVELKVIEADSSDDNYYVGLGNTADPDGTVTMHATTTNLYRVSDEDTDDIVTWPGPIFGPDGALFEYSTDSTGRRIHFISPPDFEDPMDADRDNVYEVTLRVSDRVGAMDEKPVRIAVLNVDEMGTLVLSPEQPRDGEPVTATVTDPDGVVNITDWQWFATSSRSRADAVRVSGETMSAYTGRVGEFAWARAYYRDGASVENDPVSALDERNDNPVTDTETEQHRFQYLDESGVLDDTDTLFHDTDEVIEEGLRTRCRRTTTRTMAPGRSRAGWRRLS